MPVMDVETDFKWLFELIARLAARLNHIDKEGRDRAAPSSLN